MRTFIIIIQKLLLAILSCFALCILAPRLHAQQLRKTAIVFGEKDYKYGTPLTNPEHDAEDISDSLKMLGFEVKPFVNADLKTMKNAIEDWSDSLRNYDVSLFYYSGHGAEYNGENFIFPIDAKLKRASDLEYEAFPLNRLLQWIGDAGIKTSIILLDACRDNPFVKQWSGRAMNTHGGLALMSAGKGTFIGFAAAPGSTASDGNGRNGVYTSAILKHIGAPDLTIDQIFSRVNYDVRSMTHEQQIPFKSSSLDNDFKFNPSTPISISADRPNLDSSTRAELSQVRHILADNARPSPFWLGGFVSGDIGNFSVTPSSFTNVYRFQVGFAIGGELDDYFSNNFGICLQLAYVQKGSTYNTPEILGGSLVLSYFQIPVLFKATFGSGALKPVLFAGPEVGFKLFATAKFNGMNTIEDISDTIITSVNFGMMIGAGVTYAINPAAMLFLNSAYDLGLTNLNAHYGWSDGIDTDNERLFTRDIRINAGIIFELGGR